MLAAILPFSGKSACGERWFHYNGLRAGKHLITGHRNVELRIWLGIWPRNTGRSAPVTALSRRYLQRRGIKRLLPALILHSGAHFVRCDSASPRPGSPTLDEPGHAGHGELLRALRGNTTHRQGRAPTGDSI